jgi:hypothetical protein
MKSRGYDFANHLEGYCIRSAMFSQGTTKRAGKSDSLGDFYTQPVRIRQGCAAKGRDAELAVLDTCVIDSAAFFQVSERAPRWSDLLRI